MKKIVAALIAGNEEQHIWRCVTSLKKLCQEIVVVRAIGSLAPDATANIARSLECHVSEYKNDPLCRDWPHVDDFSRARNKAFEIAYDLAGKSGWVMWADCDDVLPESMVEPHRKAIEECPAECDWILTDYVIPEQGKRSPRERFFRYQTGYWWRPIHENVQPTKTIKVNLRRDLEIVHAPISGKSKSGPRNMAILKSQDRMAAHFKFYLHYESFIRGEYKDAAKYGAEALLMSDLDGVKRYEALLNMSSLSGGEQAIGFAEQAAKLEPQRREAFAMMASLAIDAGDAVRAIGILDEMEKIPVPKFPQWTHKAEYYGWKATKLRAWAERMRGNAELAYHLEMQILDDAPRPRISLLHATRGRPIQAAQAMTLWLSRASKPERVEHIFAVDQDDESAAMLQRFSGVMQEADGYSVGAWNLAAKHATGDILIQLSDDWEPPTGWDEIVAARLDATKPQVLQVSDGYRTDDLICMAILTRPYYKAHGLFDPRYRNVYSDTDFTFRAQKNGAIVRASDVTFVHHHPLWEGRGMDDIYKRGNDPQEYARAREICNGDHGHA